MDEEERLIVGVNYDENKDKKKVKTSDGGRSNRWLVVVLARFFVGLVFLSFLTSIVYLIKLYPSSGTYLSWRVAFSPIWAIGLETIFLSLCAYKESISVYSRLLFFIMMISYDVFLALALWRLEYPLGVSQGDVMISIWFILSLLFCLGAYIAVRGIWIICRSGPPSYRKLRRRLAIITSLGGVSLLFFSCAAGFGFFLSIPSDTTDVNTSLFLASFTILFALLSLITASRFLKLLAPSLNAFLCVCYLFLLYLFLAGFICALSLRQQRIITWNWPVVFVPIFLVHFLVILPLFLVAMQRT